MAFPIKTSPKTRLWRPTLEGPGPCHFRSSPNRRRALSIHVLGKLFLLSPPSQRFRLHNYALLFRPWQSAIRRRHHLAVRCRVNRSYRQRLPRFV